MGRYILRFTGTGTVPLADVGRIRSAETLKVLEASARMLLVEARERDVAQVAESLRGWVCTPERALKLPDPRPRPRRGPKGDKGT